MRFRRALKDVEVRERDVAVLECEVPDESVPAAWYLEDQRLMPSSKYGMEQKGTRRRLTIHDVGTDDDGVYLCEMPDGAKSIAELSVKGNVELDINRKTCYETQTTINDFFLQVPLSVSFLGSWRSWKARMQHSAWRWRTTTWRSTGSKTA